MVYYKIMLNVSLTEKINKISRQPFQVSERNCEMHQIFSCGHAILTKVGLSVVIESKSVKKRIYDPAVMFACV